MGYAHMALYGSRIGHIRGFELSGDSGGILIVVVRMLRPNVDSAKDVSHWSEGAR